MPDRQMKLRFTAKPSNRVVPSLLVARAAPPATDGQDQSRNKKASGKTPTDPTLALGAHASLPVGEAPPTHRGERAGE